MDPKSAQVSQQGQPYVYNSSIPPQYASQVQGFQQPQPYQVGVQAPAATVATLPAGGQIWMVRPAAMPGVPPGLEYLAGLDQLLMHQQVELFEAVTGIETKNRYAVKNTLGQQCYFAYEESGLCMRLWCKNNRGFDMHIVDNLGQEVIHAYRDFKCCVGCCWCIKGDCCAFTLNVNSPTGVPIGRIVQECSSWKPKYAVENAAGETILVIRGPCCIWSGPCCPCEVDMNILTANESQQIGHISRQYAGFAKECCTNATNFGITFPRDLDIKAKALLVAATFLVDMMYFERQNQ